MNNMNNQLKMKLTYTVYKVDSPKNENLNCLTKDLSYTCKFCCHS